METIQEAKQFIRDNFEEGCECPACGQLVKRYSRTITSSMSYALGLIYKFFQRNPRDEWVHVEDYLKDQDIPSSIRADYSKLRYWELLKHNNEKREDGSKRSGFWKMTPKGRQFIRGEISVPKYALVFNNHFLGLEGDLINIHDTVKNKFDYGKLMGGLLNQQPTENEDGELRLFNI